MADIYNNKAVSGVLNKIAAIHGDVAAFALKDFGFNVAMQESSNIPSRKQEVYKKGKFQGYGVGRGKYQYELRGGRDTHHMKNGATGDMKYYGAGTAVNRTVLFLKQHKMLSDNSWVENLKSRVDEGEDVDFSTLPEWQQDFIFYAEKAQDPKTSMKELAQSYQSEDKDRMYAKHWEDWHHKAYPKGQEVYYDKLPYLKR